MTKPIVAIVFDEDGNVSTRVAGDVTVVWVDERMPHDRVFETTLREDRAQLEAFIGEQSAWGVTGDERQKRLEIQIANLNGPTLKLVEDQVPQCRVCGGPSPLGDPCAKCGASA